MCLCVEACVDVTLMNLCVHTCPLRNAQASPGGDMSVLEASGGKHRSYATAASQAKVSKFFIVISLSSDIILGRRSCRHSHSVFTTIHALPGMKLQDDSFLVHVTHFFASLSVSWFDCFGMPLTWLVCMCGGECERECE